MSILSDLEPKNAQIQYARPPKRQRNIGWSIGLLLLLAGTGWLYVTATAESAATVQAIDGTGILAAAQQPPLSASLPTAPAPTAETKSKDDGAAIIRSLATAPPPAETAGTAAPAPDKQREGGETAAPPRAYRSNAETKQTASTATKVANQDRSTSKPDLTRAKTTRTAKASQRQRQQKNVALAAERDIEIISAIVR